MGSEHVSIDISIVHGQDVRHLKVRKGSGCSKSQTGLLPLATAEGLYYYVARDGGADIVD